jgi:hypothetical protein
VNAVFVWLGCPLRNSRLGVHGSQPLPAGVRAVAGAKRTTNKVAV